MFGLNIYICAPLTTDYYEKYKLDRNKLDLLC